MADHTRGVALAYVDAAGGTVPAPATTIAAVLGALGEPRPAPLFVMIEGQEPWRHGRHGHVLLEDGTRVALPRALPGDLPHGYHRLAERAAETPLIVAPARCHLPDGLRDWGVAAQIYSLRSRTNWGIGDLADVRRLVAVLGDPGFVQLSPLHAPDLDPPIQPSPYYASSRLLRSPLHIAVEEVPEFALLPAARQRDLSRRGRALSELPLIDRDAVWAVKEEALRECHAAGAGAVDFAAYLQAVLVAQLAALPTLRVGLIADLAVGAAPDGRDHRARPDAYLPGFSIGAPPDPLGPDGQVWGLPVPHPERLGDDGYAGFVALLRCAMAHAGGIRIDHVMGLDRLFVIPDGATAAAGTYLRYPFRDLLAILALESRRARCIVIGEDLGTVEPGFRDRLAAAGVLSTRVAPFESSPPSAWPVQALAAVTTHDLPTSRRLHEDDADRTVAVHEALGASPCALVAVTADDLAGATEQPNVPGTVDGYPNWRIPLPVAIEDLAATDSFRRLRAAVSNDRGAIT